MSDDAPPTFDDPAAEARYYRLQAKDLQDELEDLKMALSDFQASSKELEDEMEKELANTERRETELRTEAERLRGEVDSWKTRHSATLKDHSGTLAHMQKELEGLRASEKGLRARLRDMELDNDDLEKSERAISSTLGDVESRYNKAVERTALLEQELVDKARLEEDVQRLKDEVRDGMEEMAVLRSQRDEAVVAASTVKANQPRQSGIKGPTTPQKQARNGRMPSETSVPSPDIDSADEHSQHCSGKVASAEEDVSPQLAFIRPTPSKIPSASPLSPDDDSPGLLSSHTAQHRTGSPTPNPLSRSSQVRNLSSLASRKSLTPKAKKSESIISDMKDMTSRMEGLTQRLNKRRESMMAGSAIPRATPRARVTSVMHQLSPVSPVPPMPGLPRSNSSTSSMARSASVRRGMATSPSSTTFSAMGKQSVNGEFKQPPPRPASRLGGQKTSTTPEGEAPRSTRPPSRLSSISAGGPSRPITPIGSARSPTPSSQYGSVGLSSSTRVPRRVSMGPGPKQQPPGNGPIPPTPSARSPIKPGWR